MSGLGSSNTNSPSTTRSGGSGAAMASGSNTKRSSIGTGGAGGILEGLERRMANKKDGATTVHVLLQNDDEEDETSTTSSSGDDDAVVAACAGGLTSSAVVPGVGSTNIVAVSAPDDEGVGIINTVEHSPYRRRSRPDNELTFLQGNLYPKEYGKTVLAFSLLLLAAFCNGLVIGYIHQLMDDREPLRDIVFELIPYQHWAWTAADVMVTVCGVFGLFVVFFHKHSSIILRRTALLAAVLYFLRALFLLCTYLPPPFPDAEQRCLPRWNISSDPWQFIGRAFGLVFTVGFTGNADGILCGDTIYSGHTMIYVLSGMVVWYYCPRPWRPLVPLVMLAAVAFGITTVLISRQHYTIDVVVALFVTVSIFYGYHVWCRQRRDRVPCRGNWRSFVKLACCCDNGAESQSISGRRNCRFRPIYAMFLYFERRVPHGSIPKELAWPLPWPSIMVTVFDKWNTYGTGVVTVLSRSSSSPSTGSQRRLKKRERRSSSSGGSACGDSRHALTASNSGLLTMGGQQRQHRQQEQSLQQQQSQPQQLKN